MLLDVREIPTWRHIEIAFSLPEINHYEFLRKKNKKNV